MSLRFNGETSLGILELNWLRCEAFSQGNESPEFGEKHRKTAICLSQIHSCCWVPRPICPWWYYHQPGMSFCGILEIHAKDIIWIDLVINPGRKIPDFFFDDFPSYKPCYARICPARPLCFPGFTSPESHRTRATPWFDKIGHPSQTPNDQKWLNHDVSIC